MGSLRSGLGYKLASRSHADDVPVVTAVQMKRARVIAATCMTAVRIGALKELEHEAGLFTHIVIDEAGHASEPEALCGMVHLANHGPGKAPPMVVLAGDPKQLGPIVSVPSRTVVCICASMAANPKP
jgi:hypothetical protein